MFLVLKKWQVVCIVGTIVSLVLAVAGLGTALYLTNRNSEITTTPSITTTSTKTTTTTDNTGTTGATTRHATDDETTCGYCGSEINVTLRVESGLGDSQFNHTVDLVGRQRELIYFLQQAADIKEEFRFTASYGAYGFFLNTINKLTANYTADKTWWQISDGNNQPLSTGISSYRPADGETILFTFVKSSGH